MRDMGTEVIVKSACESEWSQSSAGVSLLWERESDQTNTGGKYTRAIGKVTQLGRVRAGTTIPHFSPFWFS